MRQVSAWQFRNAVLTQNGTDLRAHSQHSTATGRIAAGRGTHRPRSHFGTSQRAVGARQTGTHVGCCACEPGPMRATSIVLETLAANHCNTANRLWKLKRLAWPTRPYACNSKQRADHGVLGWRSTTAGGAKVHQLIREPIGFQSAWRCG